MLYIYNVVVYAYDVVMFIHTVHPENNYTHSTETFN